MDYKKFNKVANMEPEILDMLLDRVCRPLKVFNQHYSHADYCKIVTPYCQQIEKNPRAVNSVIIKLRERNEYVYSAIGIRRYHQLLTVIYVVLYYCYHQDKVFQMAVFPQLKRNMGIYDSNKDLQAAIQKEMDAIIQEEALLSQREDEQNQDLSFIFDVHKSSAESIKRALLSYRQDAGAPRQATGALVDDSGHEATIVDDSPDDSGHEAVNDSPDDNDGELDYKKGKGFTSGQYACLLYAAAQLIDPKATKTSLKKLFATITGYSEAIFNRKIMGSFSEKDKKAVADLLQDVLPNWAEKIRKL